MHQRTEILKVTDSELTGWARVLEFPKSLTPGGPGGPGGPGAPGAAASVPASAEGWSHARPRLVGIAAKLDAARGGVAPQVDQRIAVCVMVAGALLCTAGAYLSPEVHTSLDLSLTADVISTIFWGGACIGAIGLFYRSRY